MRRLSGKVAIVTGGGMGIVRALSLRIAEESCTVATFGLDPKASDETADLAAQPAKWKNAMVSGIPIRRVGEPEDYAGIVAFLASEDSAFITGQTISVSAGMNMI